MPVGSASQGNFSVMATTTVMIGVMRSIAVSFLNLAVFCWSSESIQGNLELKQPIGTEEEHCTVFAYIDIWILSVAVDYV